MKDKLIKFRIESIFKEYIETKMVGNGYNNSSEAFRAIIESFVLNCVVMENDADDELIEKLWKNKVSQLLRCRK